MATTADIKNGLCIEMNNDLCRYVEGVTSLEEKRLLLEQLLNEGKVLKEKVLIPSFMIIKLPWLN